MSEARAETGPSDQSEYGGIWLRVLAALIDLLIAGSLQILFSGSAVFFLLGSAVYLREHLNYATILAVSAVLVFDCVFVLYYSLCESSAVQATPGKALLGLKVETVEGKRYRLWSAMGRVILQWLLVIAIAFVATITLSLPVAGLEAYTNKSPILEQVGATLTLLLVFVFVFVPVDDSKLQSVCDRILGRRVIKSRD
jgi:uncharacterized RDD family membrane protein YckC